MYLFTILKFTTIHRVSFSFVPFPLSYYLHVMRTPVNSFSDLLYGLIRYILRPPYLKLVSLTVTFLGSLIVLPTTLWVASLFLPPSLTSSPVGLADPGMEICHGPCFLSMRFDWPTYLPTYIVYLPTFITVWSPTSFFFCFVQDIHLTPRLPRKFRSETSLSFITWVSWVTHQ